MSPEYVYDNTDVLKCSVSSLAVVVTIMAYTQSCYNHAYRHSNIFIERKGEKIQQQPKKHENGFMKLRTA